MVRRGLRSAAGRDFCRVVLWQTEEAGGSSRDIPLPYVGLLAAGEAGGRQRSIEAGRESWRKSWLQLPLDQPVGSQLKEFRHGFQVPISVVDVDVPEVSGQLGELSFDIEPGAIPVD